jgi:hypothetical protein
MSDDKQKSVNDQELDDVSGGLSHNRIEEDFRPKGVNTEFRQPGGPERDLAGHRPEAD